MAHTYDPTTNRGKVRYRLAITRAETSWATDAEIDQALTDGGSVDGACALLLRGAMAHAAVNGDTARVAAIRDLLATFGGDLPTVDVDFPDLLPMDADYEET